MSDVPKNIDQIELDLKAEDMPYYLNPDNCAITKALARAGYPNWRDGGIWIRDKIEGKVIADSKNSNYIQLRDIVERMYDGGQVSKDFKFILNINQPKHATENHPATDPSFRHKRNRL